MTDHPRCATCAHYQPNSERIFEFGFLDPVFLCDDESGRQPPDGLGWCSRVPFRSADELPFDMDADPAIVMDGEMFKAALLTMPGFYCALHSELTR